MRRSPSCRLPATSRKPSRTPTRRKLRTGRMLRVQASQRCPRQWPPAPHPTARPPHATSSVRVDAERLDQLMHMMGELVVHRTHVESLLSHADVPGLQDAMNDLTRSSQALQTMVMQVRMIPVEAVFLRFPRLVRDLSGKLGKKVDLLLSGLRYRARPHGRRCARRPARASRAQLARSRARGRRGARGRGQAADGNARDRCPPHGRQRPDLGARRRPRHRPGARRPQGGRARSDDSRRGRDGRPGAGDRAAVLRGLLDRRGDERHLRSRGGPRCGAHDDPRPRRRGVRAVGARWSGRRRTSGCR